MARYIFIASFFLSLSMHGLSLWSLGVVDDKMWANQAEYVATDNPNKFDAKKAYGHPGGPLILGTVALQEATGLTYYDSFQIFLTFFNSLIIAGTCLLCYLMTKNNYWWPITMVILSLERLYEYSTPPSMSASLLVSFLYLLTLHIYLAPRPPSRYHAALWSLASALLVSTRFDIGVIFSFAFLLMIFKKAGWRWLSIVLAGSAALFLVFDPFMWSTPLQHLKDMIWKASYHYQDRNPARIDFAVLFSISFLPLLSIFFGAASLFSKKKTIEPRFILMPIAATIFLSVIFLTAQFQTPRYFLPLILLWLILLPLFIYNLIDQTELNFLDSHLKRSEFKKYLKIGFLASLISIELLFFAYSWWLNGAFSAWANA